MGWFRKTMAVASAVASAVVTTGIGYYFVEHKWRGDEDLHRAMDYIFNRAGAVKPNPAPALVVTPVPQTPAPAPVESHPGADKGTKAAPGKVAKGKAAKSARSKKGNTKGKSTQRKSPPRGRGPVEPAPEGRGGRGRGAAPQFPAPETPTPTQETPKPAPAAVTPSHTGNLATDPGLANLPFAGKKGKGHYVQKDNLGREIERWIDARGLKNTVVTDKKTGVRDGAIAGPNTFELSHQINGAAQWRVSVRNGKVVSDASLENVNGKLTWVEKIPAEAIPSPFDKFVSATRSDATIDGKVCTEGAAGGVVYSQKGNRITLTSSGDAKNPGTTIVMDFNKGKVMVVKPSGLTLPPGHVVESMANALEADCGKARVTLRQRNVEQKLDGIKPRH